MKKLLLLLAILPFMISCNGQDKIDWATVNLPIPLDSISKNYKLFQPYSNINSNIKYYKSLDQKFLYVWNTNLDGGLELKYDDGYTAINENFADIFVSEPDNKLLAIRLYTEDPKSTDKLINLVNEKLGKTDYHYFFNDNEKATVRQKIWKNKNKYYTLEMNDPDYYIGKVTKTARLTIFNDENNPFVKYWFYDGGNFSGFYGQYLDEKNKPEHNGKNYTYRSFVEQMDRENKNFGTTSDFFVK